MDANPPMNRFRADLDMVRGTAPPRCLRPSIVDRRSSGTCQPRHRHLEFLQFLQRIDRAMPKRLQVHSHPGLRRHPYASARAGVTGLTPPLPLSLHADLSSPSGKPKARHFHYYIPPMCASRSKCSFVAFALFSVLSLPLSLTGHHPAAQ